MPKWMTNAQADDCVADVAAACLRGRLKQVGRHLPRAAKKAEEDIEHVHQLRVWTRRAAAALRMFHDFLPRRRRKWVASQLKRVRRAAGDARDLDVLQERLREWSNPPVDLTPLRDDVARRRKAAQPAIVEVYRELTDDAVLKRRCRKLIARIRFRGDCGEGEPRYGPWADVQLQDVLEPFYRAASADLSNLENLHAFRIAGKRLRYTMELLAGAYPRSFRKQLYGEIALLQDKLGLINDHRVAHARYVAWAEQADAAPEQCAASADLLRRLAEFEAAQLDSQRQAFFNWWTPVQIESIRSRFNAMLALRPIQRG